jgi:hypothetical protein
MELVKATLRHLEVLEVVAQRLPRLMVALVDRHILLVVARQLRARDQQLQMEAMEALHQPVQYHHL